MRCTPTISKSPNGLLLVGEAPGEQEALIGQPFIGASGQLLTQVLADAGIERRDCHLTNVFMDRPNANNIELFFAKKSETSTKLPPLSIGKYLKDDRRFELDRLKDEITSLNPTCIVALGGTASWALLQDPRITKVRGTPAESKLVPGVKVFPTFHPAYAMRNWADRHIMVADFIKVKRELSSSKITRPHRQVHIIETVNDLRELEALRYSPTLSVDIETRRGQITCIGFSQSIKRAYVVPFIQDKPPFNFWASPSDETLAVNACRAVLRSDASKVFQNGLYDLQYIYRIWGFLPKNCREDTMIRHHAVQAEMKKDLGFLGSLYTTEASWKLLRETKTEKRDE